MNNRGGRALTNSSACTFAKCCYYSTCMYLPWEYLYHNFPHANIAVMKKKIFNITWSTCAFFNCLWFVLFLCECFLFYILQNIYYLRVEKYVFSKKFIYNIQNSPLTNESFIIIKPKFHALKNSFYQYFFTMKYYLQSLTSFMSS